jgi:hypothetical protein
VPKDVLAPGLLRYCDILAAGGAGKAAVNLSTTFREGRIEPGSLLTASLGRDQASIRRGAEHLGLAPDLLWLIAELTVGPFAYALQRRVLQTEDPVVTDALRAWQPGFCPACGSWPALAEMVGGHRVLRCSFCAAAWTAAMECCAYCRAGAPEFQHLQPGAERFVEACGHCRGYLKVARVATLSPFPFVAITDLETSDLDMEAMRRDYHRPALDRSVLNSA